MTTDGRTYWWACDAAWYDRERVADLTLMFGPTGAASLHWLCCHAKMLNDGGAVKTGYSAVTKGIGGVLADVTSAVRYAAEIGALDDFQEDGKRFACRISGWENDQSKGGKAMQNARAHAAKVSRYSVPIQYPSGQDSDRSCTETTTSSLRSDVVELFGYWQAACKHPTAKLTADRLRKVTTRLREGYTVEQIRTAIDGAARGAFVNDAGNRFDDLTLICRNGSKLEDFIARATAKPKPGKAAPLTADHFTPDKEAEAMAQMHARLSGGATRQAGSDGVKKTADSGNPNPDREYP